MLIDAFIFFNEKELVELRVKYLSSVVDFFVVVEANITHQGKEKSFNFLNILKKKLNKFSNKIKYHQLNIDPEKIKNEEGWSFSSFGGPIKIKEKFESIAHKEFNNDKFKNTDHIINCQKTGTDLFHRNIQSRKIDKNFFPKDLLNLMEQNPTFYFGSSD